MKEIRFIREIEVLQSLQQTLLQMKELKAQGRDQNIVAEERESVSNIDGSIYLNNTISSETMACTAGKKKEKEPVPETETQRLMRRLVLKTKRINREIQNIDKCITETKESKKLTGQKNTPSETLVTDTEKRMSEF